MMDKKDLIGKVIAKIDIDRNGVKILCADGTMFVYGASCGEYSIWDMLGSGDKVIYSRLGDDDN